MANLLVDLMRANDAPASQFERMGLPVQGPIEDSHLLVDAHWQQVVKADEQDWREYPSASFCTELNTPLCELAGSTAAEQISKVLGIPLQGQMLKRFAHLTAWHLAVMLPSVTPAQLQSLDAHFRKHADA